MKSSYLRKIVSVKKLSSIIKKNSKKQKTILCHGNFDVVHPGHIRHLNYAKSKANILVVSITSDANIKKGNGTPGKSLLGKVTMKQVREIAKEKLEDLNAYDIDEAAKIIMGSARSMGMEVV